MPSSFFVACQYDQYALLMSGLDGFPEILMTMAPSSVGLNPALFNASVPVP